MEKCDSGNELDDRRRNKSKPIADEGDVEASKTKKHKTRKELLSETILNRYHESQRLQTILSKTKQADEEESAPIEAVSPDDGDTVSSDKNILPDAAVNNEQDQTEADRMLDDVNQLQEENRKKLAKEKKLFKKKLRQEREAAAKKNDENRNDQQSEESKQEVTKKESGKQAIATSYLKQWRKHRDDWKFRKNIHTWLLKNWKHADRISDKRFRTLLKYLKSTESKTLALQRLEREAKLIVDNAQQQGASEEKTTTTTTTSDQSYDRARNILQWIEL